MKTPRERMHIDNYFDFRDKVSGVNYYADTMLNKTLTMFKYNNLPDSLPERELELLLQTDGKCIITEHNGEIVALGGSYAPPNDIYYRPTQYIVNNPWANINKTYELGTEAVLVRNDPLDRGLLPIIHKYGAILTETDLTMFLADINFRTIFAITANTDDEMQSGKEYLRQIEEGRQGIMLSEELSDGIKTQPYSNSSQGYITQLIELKQYLWGTFLNEIGLNANYNMKRERLSANETDLNEDSLRPLIDAMLEERQFAIDKVNEMFGTNITVEFNSAWSKYNEEEIITDEGEIIDDNEIQDITNNDELDSSSDSDIYVDNVDELEETETTDDTETIEESETEDNITVDIEININEEPVEDETVEETEEETEDEN